ncbi:MAG: hypothetical protein AAF699_14940 [Pseudomonadota bacterium]
MAMTYLNSTIGTSTRICASLLLCAFSLALSPPQAWSEQVTNGYICAPKNPGGEDTRRFYREQDGVAINLSPDSSFPIVCPVVIDPDASLIGVLIRFGNTSTSTQSFACALEEYDLLFNLVRTTGKSTNLAAGATGDFSWGPVDLISVGNFLSIRCILPPRGTVGTFVWL